MIHERYRVERVSPGRGVVYLKYKDGELIPPTRDGDPIDVAFLEVCQFYREILERFQHVENIDKLEIQFPRGDEWFDVKLQEREVLTRYSVEQVGTPNFSIKTIRNDDYSKLDQNDCFESGVLLLRGVQEKFPGVKSLTYQLGDDQYSVEEEV